MIDPGHPRKLSIVRRCELASISRSSFYREPTAEKAKVTLQLDASHRRAVPRDTLWYGSRQIGASICALQRLVRGASSRFVV